MVILKYYDIIRQLTVSLLDAETYARMKRHFSLRWSNARGGGVATRDQKGRKGDDSNLDLANTVNRAMLDK